MRGIRSVALVAGALLWAPAGAAAAEKPVVTTGAAASIEPTTVVLNGTVNPKGAATSYFFQYGTTVIYGATTSASGAGAGTKGVKVAVSVTGLAPATTYHYRLVAQNSKGLTRGKDRTFKTKRQPLGVSLAATPNPILAGGATTLAGTLSGTGNGGRQVVLQSNPYPYTQGFAQVGNALVTDPAGGFAFPILSVPVNTIYRVQMPARPDVVSPLVAVGTTYKVTRHVKVTRRGERRGRLRFRGRITPTADGRQVLIQKLDDVGNWVTISETVARHSSSSFSRYRERIWQRRGGRYRVLVNVNDIHSPSASRSIRVRNVTD
jgi:hypothetical protein